MKIDETNIDKHQGAAQDAPAASFSLMDKTDRDALIAGLKERGIEAFPFGAGGAVAAKIVSALAGGNVEVHAYQVYDDVRIAAINHLNPLNFVARGLEEALNAFGIMFGLCETGERDKYAPPPPKQERVKARVAIIVTDTDEGRVRVTFEMDPPPGNLPATEAQEVALNLISHMNILYGLIPEEESANEG